MLEIILLVISICLSIIVLLQSGKSQGVASAFTGQSTGLFKNVKERGPELVISRITLGLGIAFFITAILIKMR